MRYSAGRFGALRAAAQRLHHTRHPGFKDIERGGPCINWVQTLSPNSLYRITVSSTVMILPPCVPT